MEAHCITLPYSLSESLLLFEPVALKLVPLAILALNRAICFERSYYLKHLESTPDFDKTADRLLRRTLDLIPLGPKKTTSSSVTDFIAQEPPVTTLIFTDGSAIPNPGPSGAGVYCVLPPLLGGGVMTFSVTTDLNSNNIGEMTALLDEGIVAHSLSECFPAHRSAFFSDSAISIGHILDGWAFKEDPTLARSTRLCIRTLTVAMLATLDWVRGHDNIEGNERADSLAKDGARATANGAPKYLLTAHFPDSIPSDVSSLIIRRLNLHGFRQSLSRLVP